MVDFETGASTNSLNPHMIYRDTTVHWQDLSCRATAMAESASTEITQKSIMFPVTALYFE